MVSPRSFSGSLCWRRPIFPARLQASIVGTGELNFCVRNGNRWTLTAINTDSSILTGFPTKINMKLFAKEDW